MMNMKINNILILLFLFFLSSCHSEKMPSEPTLQGTVSMAKLQLSVDMTVQELDSVRSLSSLSSSVDLNSYVIDIISSEGDTINTWVYSDMPEIISLNVGSYTIEAKSSPEASIGVDKPYYYGSENFEVKYNEITELDPIKCTLNSVCVSFKFEDSVRDLVSDDFTLNFTIDNKTLTLSKNDEGKYAYIPVSKDENVLSINWVGTIDGELESDEDRIEALKKGYHHSMLFSFEEANEDGSLSGGELNLTITVDNTINSEDENVTVNPGDEPEIDDFPVESNPGGESGDGSGDDETDNAPTIVGTNFNNNTFDIDGEPLVIAKGQNVTLQVTINALEGISHVFVEINSETLTEDILTEVKLAKSFDLAEPGSLEEGLKGLGFPVKDQVIGQTSVLFDITQFTSLLGIYGAANHNFIIRVVDKKNQEVTKTLKIKSIE